MLKKTDKPVLIDFFAEWCGPCQMAAPIIDKLATEFADQITIAKVDVDENQASAQQFGVMSIPTVIILRRSGDDEVEVVSRQVGFPGEEGYRSMIKTALEKKD
jgi:thioredoxin 1